MRRTRPPRRSLILLGLLVLASGCARNAPPSAAPAAAAKAAAPTVSDADDLSDWLTEMEANARWWGSLAVTRDGAPLFDFQRGSLDLAGTARVDADSRFRIGSINKTFTSTMIHQLVDEGRLSLDATLDTWFPTIPNAKRITIEQLLDHHSGVFSFTDDPEYTSWMETPQTREALLTRLASYEPAFPPGAKKAYSNSGYVLLGWILEAVEGRPYAESLQARITGPLGLERTSAGKEVDVADNDASSLTWDGAAWAPATETDPSIPGGAGAMASTPTDLCTFAHALFSGDLVSEASLASMQTLHDGIGRGLFRLPFFDRWVWGHGGGIDGFTSLLAYLPGDDVCFALTTNGANMDTNQLAIAGLSVATGAPWTPPPVTPVVTIDPSTLDRFLGVWASDAVQIDIAITREGAQLMGQATGQPKVPLTPTSETTFVFEPAGFTLTFGGHPEVTTLHLTQGGRTIVFTRKP